MRSLCTVALVASPDAHYVCACILGTGPFSISTAHLHHSVLPQPCLVLSLTLTSCLLLSVHRATHISHHFVRSFSKVSNKLTMDLRATSIFFDLLGKYTTFSLRVLALFSFHLFYFLYFTLSFYS